jgi:phosphoribosylformimino-5-aminoimidazole carboxamide ribotide isomerase
MLLIPAIDLRNGRCVRLFKGDFNAETRYEYDPLDLHERYRGFGATWLHVVDLDGAKDGVLANRPTIVRLAAQGTLRVQVGGGMRSAAVIEDVLAQGVERVVVGSAAIESPAEVAGWFRRFGADRICLALDVKVDPADGEPKVRTRGWTEGTGVTLWSALEPFLPVGLKHVLCTDIDRDGALTGPNLDLYRRALALYPGIAWQASGGVRDAADLAALDAIGMAAAVSGKALLEQRITSEELRPFLPNASSPASTSATARS